MNSRLLKAAIVKSGLSREELAKKIGVSTTTSTRSAVTLPK